MDRLRVLRREIFNNSRHVDLSKLTVFVQVDIFVQVDKFCTPTGDESRAEHVALRDDRINFYDAKVVAQEKSHFQDRFSRALPSDGRSRHISADGRRPCEGARRC